MSIIAPKKQKMLGFLLCLGAVVVVVAGWTWARSIGESSTDNAYVRGDVTSLAPKVAGYVTTIEVEDNQAVRVGDVLFRIDDRDYRARLTQAMANVEAALARLTNVDADTQLQHVLVRQAEAQRRSTVADRNLATKSSDRRRELIRTNAVSQAQVDESDTALSRAEAAVSAASAMVEAQQQRIAVLATQREAAIAAVAQAQAARDLAQIDLDNTVVHAPVDGVIGNRQVRIGRLVAPGASLLDIVPVRDVWIVANFKETQIEHIRPGQRARIAIDGYPNEMLEGVVVLLRHKFNRRRRPVEARQHGHRGNRLTRASMMRRCTVAIEFGTWRSGRNGGSPGSVTAANVRLREPRGGTRS
ncbi:HlyD family secretion protein [Bradyrhizobium sp. LTSPM299]|uniref:HlyD family secretion protein n=1 Tax=Bradyrhizobium sp. LTSPM299 TaxID=1619233 RepID=UPI0009E3A40E|nr:HlyD family secretion protein [Bradyrhizobium sp. LTSPM299]